MKKFTHYYQSSKMDCGPTCLRMIAKFYGKAIPLKELSRLCQTDRQGASLMAISEAAEAIGCRTTKVRLTYAQLIQEAPLPAILHWGQNHYVVITETSKMNKVIIADPSQGMMTYTPKEFNAHWLKHIDQNGERFGIALLLEPTSVFAEYESTIDTKITLSWRSMFQYLLSHKKFFFQLVLTLALGSLLQLIFPFLTQSIVDTGISTQDLSFITLILVAQLMLFVSRTMVEFIRSRLLLHVSMRINLSILSDFWMKLMRLPIAYFDTKQTGDTMQRIGDHRRIENFLTGNALPTIFSAINIILFSIVLLNYNLSIFLIFSIGSILYLFWIKFFQGYRKRLDYEQFRLSSAESTTTLQMITGMQEIKLHNAEQLHRWEWEDIQAKIFRLSFKNLSINQYQQAGTVFLNEGKNIIITFISAKLVIQGDLSFGAMLAIQYIVGSLQGPVEQLLAFMQSAQYARISMDRLNEVHQIDDEEPASQKLNTRMPSEKSIEIKNLSYAYLGSDLVLKNVSTHIPQGKTTAIVGMSGSGKTTLIKLLLRFYQEYDGEISVGNTSLRHLSQRGWRDICGCVMQEGYIFSNTIARNIAVNTADPDYEKLIHACRVANILTFIETLPLGFNTQIGAEGKGISSGQRQRILIARAVYKDPHYVFFDEATNSLDANTEKSILENLNQFFQGRTVVIVAHRLSTVKHADNILVMQDGQIIESGTHENLSEQRGVYFELVKISWNLENNAADTSLSSSAFATEQIRSAEISEMISRQPSFLVRWGVVIILGIIGLLFTVSFFIKYPDIVIAEAYLNSNNAPKEIVSKSSGRLTRLFVSEGELVKAGDLIGVVESVADFTEVLRLSVILDSIKNLASLHKTEKILLPFSQSFSNLGELQTSYQLFIQALQTYSNYSKTGYFTHRREMLWGDIRYLERLNGELNIRKQYLTEDLLLSDSTYEANRRLGSQLVLSPFELRSERSKLIDKQMNLPDINSEIISNESRQHEKKKEIADLDNQALLQDMIFFQALNTLKNQIGEWKVKFLLLAPMEGRVVFPRFVQANQEIAAGQLICYVHADNPAYYAEMIVPQAGFGKVKKGQKVVLKLFAYPWQEFGSLQGNVTTISTVSTDSGYFAKVSLHNGVNTSRDREIVYRSGLLARAEIVTNEKRLIERLVSSIRK